MIKYKHFKSVVVRFDYLFLKMFYGNKYCMDWLILKDGTDVMCVCVCVYADVLPHKSFVLMSATKGLSSGL